jgi:hypothetical protein
MFPAYFLNTLTDGNDSLSSSDSASGEISLAVTRGGIMRQGGTPTLLGVDEVEYLPDQIWAAGRSPGVSSGGPQFELRETIDGTIALLAYSSLANLIKGCGTGQSWVEVPTSELPRLRRIVGFDVIALDLSLPIELRHRELDASDADFLEEMAPQSAPELIWIPALPAAASARKVDLELWPDPNGQRALFAYTSPAQLRAGCGPYQAFVSIRATDLRIVATEAGAQTVLFNPFLDERARHTARDQVARPSLHCEEEDDDDDSFLWKGLR